MKAVFEFDLSDPDDRMAHLRATYSLEMALALWDMGSRVSRIMENLTDQIPEHADEIEMALKEIHALLPDLDYDAMIK